MASELDTVVVGGGLAGIATALELKSKGRSVLVLEAGPALGGKCGTRHSPQGHFPIGPTSFNGRHPIFWRLFDALGLSDETGQVKGETGTEIRIPGLGKLGVLPKMDFGLELLYGAAEGQPAAQPETAPSPEDDLMIRGTVKHRF